MMVSPKEHAVRTEKLIMIEQAMTELSLTFSREKNVFLVKESSHNEGVRPSTDGSHTSCRQRPSPNQA